MIDLTWLLDLIWSESGEHLIGFARTKALARTSNRTGVRRIAELWCHYWTFETGSMLQCMEILCSLRARVSVSIRFEGKLATGHSIQSKIIALAFSMAAEIERDWFQRTKEALRFKKEQGITLGRPKGPGKSKLDIFGPENRGSVSERLNAAVHRAALPHNRSNLANWLKKEWVEDNQSPHAIVRARL